jgi:hypothetical protein
MRLRDELGVFYNDEDFAELYPERGQSAIPPWRLTVATRYWLVNSGGGWVFAAKLGDQLLRLAYSRHTCKTGHDVK